jgi:hypothetical protein
MTLIRDLNGNIFGGFTPIPWESPFSAKRKEDSTGKTFLFTRKNPWNCPPTTFRLINPSSTAIRVDRKKGPCFGDCEICISDECGKKGSESGTIGTRYVSELLFAQNEHYDDHEIYRVFGELDDVQWCRCLFRSGIADVEVEWGGDMI